MAGRYSFNTGQIGMSCTDGSRGTNPALALNFDVNQNINEITLVSTGAAGITPGLTIIESSEATGNVQPNSSFIVNQFATARIDGISGNVSINYNVSGRFNTNGWSGTYSYTLSSASLGSCVFTTSFSGTKFSSAQMFAKAQFLDSYPGIYASLYDPVSKTGATLAKGQVTTSGIK